jgi:hypothetical protein
MKQCVQDWEAVLKRMQIKLPDDWIIIYILTYVMGTLDPLTFNIYMNNYAVILL